MLAGAAAVAQAGQLQQLVQFDVVAVEEEIEGGHGGIIAAGVRSRSAGASGRVTKPGAARPAEPFMRDCGVADERLLHWGSSPRRPGR
ncbi:hypothetical protein GCM10007167_01140 [Vulcaniibacterium thermophilum]|uniref:Uncharacterized protein n=1 Tax=Vulcaniibacterium thermophilum TaxID=1169913 RepID=A0A919D944_9GAMM|nr:hypothetical protein GCM10007167_01140 [Vulcaniibacterium thermophilum]